MNKLTYIALVFGVQSAQINKFYTEEQWAVQGAKERQAQWNFENMPDQDDDDHLVQLDMKVNSFDPFYTEEQWQIHAQKVAQANWNFENMPDFDDENNLTQLGSGIQSTIHQSLAQGVRFVTDEEYNAQQKASSVLHQQAKNMPDFMEDDHLVQVGMGNSLDKFYTEEEWAIHAQKVAQANYNFENMPDQDDDDHLVQLGMGNTLDKFYTEEEWASHRQEMIAAKEGYEMDFDSDDHLLQTNSFMAEGVRFIDDEEVQVDDKFLTDEEWRAEQKQKKANSQMNDDLPDDHM